MVVHEETNTSEKIAATKQDILWIGCFMAASRILSMMRKFITAILLDNFLLLQFLDGQVSNVVYDIVN